jgi:hypothetical protein
MRGDLPVFHVSLPRASLPSFVMDDIPDARTQAGDIRLTTSAASRV